MTPPPKTTAEAIADAEHRIDTIITPGHTQFINIRADTVRVLLDSITELEVDAKLLSLEWHQGAEAKRLPALDHKYEALVRRVASKYYKEIA